jgi:hypothetical protein
VVRPADRQQPLVVPARRDACQAFAPLPGALEVAHELAGEDQVAAREADREVIVHLPGSGGRRRLVQIGHPPGGFTLADAREALERERGHLEIQVIELAGQCPCLGAALARQRRVAGERERRLAQQQPGALTGRPAPLEQPAGPRQPTVPDGRLPPEDAVVPGERDGDAGRVGRPPGLPVGRIGALAGVEDERRLVQEPAGRREALERLRTCVHRERALECRACLLPCAALQGRLAGGERIAAGVHGGHRQRDVTCTAVD